MKEKEGYVGRIERQGQQIVKAAYGKGTPAKASAKRGKKSADLRTK